MQLPIAYTRPELSAAIARLREGGKRIALVPTMGALHAGHLALVAEARRHADHVIVYIFVNRRQFAPHEDFDRYPRPFAEDVAKLQEAGVDLLYAPEEAEVYPEGYSTVVSVKGVSERMEGAARPQFFDGVATVLAKMFIRVMPDVAVFGEKDYQQLAVVRRLVKDLDLPIKIIGLPTIREKLALSSRNAYLSEKEREIAPKLYETLVAAAGEICHNRPPAGVYEQAVKQLLDAGFASVDYIEYVDGEHLQPLQQYTPGGRLFAAAWLGKTRLIDNIAVSETL